VDEKGVPLEVVRRPRWPHRMTLGDQLELTLELLDDTEILEDDAALQAALPPNVIPFRSRRPC
jgi:hypothetical protein